MLVLTRKRAEMIRIGDNIFIKVIKTGRSTVKIGIEAPADVRILRAELCDEGRTAAKGDSIEAEEPEESEADVVYSDQFPHPHFV